MYRAIYGVGMLDLIEITLLVMFGSNDHTQENVGSARKMAWITPKIWLMSAVDTKSAIETGKIEGTAESLKTYAPS
jgi:hypothetical protein